MGGRGLCSYLLIGFWFEKQSASDAGKKAFIVNRIGDAGFVLGMFLIFTTFGTRGLPRAWPRRPPHMPVEWAWGGALTMIGLFLFVGATGKSAQLPLYVWLPDAMEGPTPVSALIHAATMVTAGVYMVARSSAIYAHAPKRAGWWSRWSACTTALFAASDRPRAERHQARAGLLDREPARLHVRWPAASAPSRRGVFHLMTHAFFKALLFLGSGSVIHGMSGEQDMRKMGGLRKQMPVDAPHDADRLPRDRRRARPGRLLLEGRDPVVGLPHRRGYGRWVWTLGFVIGRPDRVLHVPPVPHDVPRRVPRDRGAGAPPARVAAGR